MRRTRLWPVLLAVCPALFAVATNLVTNQVSLSPLWWAVVATGCVLLAGVLVIQTYRELRGPGAAPAAEPAAAPVPPGPVTAPVGAGGATVLGGLRTGEPGAGVMILLCGIFVAGLAALVMSRPGSATRKWHPGPHDPTVFGAHPLGSWVGLGVVLLVFVVPAVLKAVGRGRGRLEFSAESLVVSGPRRRVVLPWSELTAVEVRSTFFGGTWLEARPVAGSPLLMTPPTMGMFDAKRRVLRVCDLGAMGVPAHAVRAALARWQPSPSRR
ncbi:hypothetical protein ACIQ9P_32870 [Kitasatospora sp. NPDC094019]|uniref:hypothetical protein n=1 Tax=Kitasatospora sp. NPDC094019 TaxID=3364091 RepID=UPI00382C6650